MRRTYLRAAAAGAGLVTVLALGPGAGAGPFTQKGTQPGLTFPIQPPTNCASCHGDFDVANDVEPHPTWAGSMMANAARDPLFWAALDVANNDLPGAGDFCLRCHAPTGWLGGRSEPPGGSVDGCGLLGNLDENGNDFEGISCHFCHRMMENTAPPPGQDPVYFENGQYWIDDVECATGQGGPCRRGPYDYPGAVGAPEPPHDWAYSDYHVSGDICGNCHNVTSPVLNLIDESGVDTGLLFPIERTFKEWQQSDFAVDGGDGVTTCQNCHLPDATEDPVYACNFGNPANRTGDLPVHRMAGGNAWIPQVLKGEYPNLVRGDSYDSTTAEALRLLQQESASVELLAPAGADPDSTLDLQVRVTNLTGHKLPTGYPEGRRMWLTVTARDAGDAVFWESGAYDAVTGELTEDDQIRLYRVEPGIWNLNGTNECDAADAMGSPIFHFVLNNCFVVDSRIPPAGFTGGADPETRPVGYTYPETTPGSGVLVNHDLADYAVPIPPGTAFPISIEASLHYQTASREYVEFLLNQAIDNGFPDDCIPRSAGTPDMSRGEILYDMWSRYDRSPPVEMGTDAAQLVEATLFADGFESGGTGAWSGST